MKVTIDDAQLVKLIRDVIADKVQEVIKAEMGEIVTGELAKHKLMGKGPKSLQDMINDKLKGIMPTKSSIMRMAREQVHDIAWNEANSVKLLVRQTVQKRVEESLKAFKY